MHQPFDEAEAGRQLAKIAKGDGCTTREALQRALALYTTVQMSVWDRGCVLGVVDQNFNVLGILASGPNEEPESPDPNFEIDLD
jgi:hypothetical protein